MTDDQGYGDVAVHGNPALHTPNMDRLHEESIRLSNFHVDPTCAPTRSALMTGKYSHRVGVWHTVQGGNNLRATETTMADVFKHNGYQTAIFGKWHLGSNYPYRPMDRGFDEWLGLGDGGVGTTDDYFWNDRVNDVYWHNGVREPARRDGYDPDVLFGAAIDYLKKRDGQKPFFIYLPTYVPHGPWTIPDPKMAVRYSEMGLSPRLSYFFAMIERADQNLGRLRKALDDLGLADNTIFIFLTDNGTNSGANYFNAGMKDGKGSVFDGGHRVPCFIHWPAGNLGAARDVPTLAAHIDLLPTLAELCTMELSNPVDFDGTSLVPLLRSNGSNWPERTLCVEKQRTVKVVKGAGCAVMTQQWRLVNLKQLFNMTNDPGQQHDVAEQNQTVVEQLRREFDHYWERVTPHDREFATPIAGTIHDKEIFLTTSDLRESAQLWNHAAVAEGGKAEGVWHLEIAEAGTYDIEVRRWPTEVNAPMAGAPVSTKTPDSWYDKKPRLNLLEGDTFKTLPVAEVSLQVGEFHEKRSVSPDTQSVVFAANLPRGKITVDAALDDGDGMELTKAYYVYVRKR